MLSLNTLALATTFVLAAAATRRVVRARRAGDADAFLRFDDVKRSARTGDIILFHKTSAHGLLDGLEFNVVSPLVFGRTEFRHCGIVVRRGSDLHVLECADENHSGASAAKYVTTGRGLRLVEIETLLKAYELDNTGPHFGILHIEREIPDDVVQRVLAEYPPVDYLALHRAAMIFLCHVLLPAPWARRVDANFEGEMTCSEFLHAFLHRCGVLAAYPSKAFVTYAIENETLFRSLQRVKYSNIVRFRYGAECTAT